MLRDTQIWALRNCSCPPGRQLNGLLLELWSADYGDDEYGFTYSDDEDVGDEDVEIENMYYNSKGPAESCALYGWDHLHFCKGKVLEVVVAVLLFFDWIEGLP